MNDVDVDLPYLSSEMTRHGARVLFVRRFGRRIRIREEPGTPGFLAEYQAALAELGGKPAAQPGAKITPFARGTFGWLAAQYFGSAEFTGLDLESQATRRGVIEACLREPHTADDPEPMGNCPIRFLTSAKIRRLRDLKKGLPGAANNRKKYLSAMFTWAMEEAQPALMTSNPARDVKRVKYATSGFHNWTVDEVEQYRARHAIGTKARLALEMVLFVGVRRSDLVLLGRQHVRGDVIRFVPRKSRYKRKRISEKPLLPQLADVIAKSPCGPLTFIVTEYGLPFTAKGFGGWFRERCDEAGLHHCSAHGLRKAGATLAAENGATVHMLMAMFDWVTIAQAQPYIDAVDRRRLAAQGMPLLVRRSD